MNNKSTVEKILDLIKNQDLTKFVLLDLLSSFIECSEDAKIRSKCIEHIKELKLDSEKLYKVLENLLISDESPLVRSSAAEIILGNSIEKKFSLIKWILLHEQSPIVLKTIFEFFEKFNIKKFLPIRAEIRDWFSHFAKNIGIVPEEAKFILDLEVLFNNQLDAHPINEYTYYFYDSLRKIKPEPWLRIKNSRIIELNLNLFSWKYLKQNPEFIKSIFDLRDPELFFYSIKKFHQNHGESSPIPKSITFLSSLKKLHLRYNNLHEIPQSILDLSSLKMLDLSHNNISEIPSAINSLKSLTYLNLKSNKIKLIPDSLKNLDCLKVILI